MLFSPDFVSGLGTVSPEAEAYPGSADVGIPGGAYIAGRWQTEDLTLEVHDPQDGTLVGVVADTTPEDVARAIGYVHQARAQTRWPLWARREALETAARSLFEQQSRFIDIISAESSKTVVEARREVQRCAETLRLSAAASEELTGQTIPFEDSRAGQGRVGWYVRHPVGVVAAITPFNDPLNLVAHKVGPALIGGNAVVLKPSTETPLTALAFIQLLLEAGVPAGRIAVVCGGTTAGEALVSDERVDLVSFTGGPRTAEKITAAAGARKMLMELGGNCPTIVCADAEVERAAEAIVSGAFGVAGQNCLSVQRVYVHSSLFDRVLEEVVHRTGQLSIGSKRDETTDIGPLITQKEARRIEEWVEEAATHGATVHTGGKRHHAYYQPTVLTNVPDHCRVVREEVFGPVVSLASYDDTTQAINAANSSAYALQAGIFTKSLDTAFSLAEKLTAGAVIINDSSDVRIDAMPFGGFKKSGIGREGVRHTVHAMTEPKSTIVTLN